MLNKFAIELDGELVHSTVNGLSKAASFELLPTSDRSITKAYSGQGFMSFRNLSQSL